MPFHVIVGKEAVIQKYSEINSCENIKFDAERVK